MENLENKNSVFKLICKKCNNEFMVNYVDFEEREKLKKYEIECVTWFSRWLRAIASFNLESKFKFNRSTKQDEFIGIKRVRKRSLCYSCYFNEAYNLHNNRENSSKTIPENKWLDGSYIK